MSEQSKYIQHIAAAEYLKGFVDNVLEAFQAGTGIKNGMPEPITLDIARRLIWQEIQRSILSLTPDTEKTGNLWRGGALWLRVAAPTVEQLLLGLENIGDGDDWSIRCFGPRQDGDATVAYVVLWLEDLSNPPREIAVILARIHATANVTVRDWSFGRRPTWADV